MKYLDEYREPEAVHAVARRIRTTVTRPWTLMEVCGGQTHSILKNGLEDLLPAEISLVHGPGCPVCVTPIELIDRAIHIASQPGAIFTTFGDMLRVPGSSRSLFDAKASGSDVRIVYSPLDALKLARAHPSREVVFFAVGFETTAPASAMAVWQAAREGLANFSILAAHVLVPPAMRAILDAPECRIDAFLAPGHVCTVAGYEDYEELSRRYRVPIVVTGFEPLDLLQGVANAVEQLESGSARVDNEYARVVAREGNAQARQVVAEVFEAVDRPWRGIGPIAASGLRLREPYSRFDAARRFPAGDSGGRESADCIAGLVLTGVRKPHECAAFGNGCTPEHPLGAPMVSSEGACAAYYLYGRRS